MTLALVAALLCDPDIILVNGRVHTVDVARPAAEAVAVCGDRITAVGATAEIRALATERTRVVDLGGRLVVPGFNDAHVHFIDGAGELVGVNLRPAADERDFTRRLAEHVKTLSAGRWVLGGYWDHEAWPSKALPTRALLDAVTPDHPVFVQRLDGHMGVANSLAMRLAGVTRDTPAPDGGTIVRDASGEPTGLFKDNAMGLITRAVPPASLDEVLERARAALKHAAAMGVTTVQDLTASATELRAYQVLRERGELTARIYSTQSHGIAGLVDAGIRTGFGDDWIRIGGIKLFADGSMGSGTAVFFEPYADDPSTKGLLIQSPEELERQMREADAAGFQLVVHAIGDRANAIVIDAVEKVVRANGARDRRPRIEHAQVVRDEDKQRMARLGIIASIQPSHCIDDMRWAETRIGRDRCRIAYDFKSFVDAGVRVAFGTDWFVEPLDPMIGLYAAVTRQFPNGTPPGGWFPEEKISMSQAIEFYTLGSAYAQFAEREKGSLTPGKLADLVVLSKDVFAIPPREILETRPVLTMVGGRIVFDRGQLSVNRSRSAK
ncbi:MAG TPA: amidohydrolase [Vicinamibacterales bacterium]|nr:amidohydrolase [Vicinamibacterales bacterium]